MIIHVTKPKEGATNLLIIPSRGRHLAPILLSEVPVNDVQARLLPTLEQVYRREKA